jgi:4-hydroxymandelate oxidase
VGVRKSTARRPRSKAKPRARPRTSGIDRCVNLADFEALARRRMRPAFYDYYAGGAEDERTLARNRGGFDRFVFLPRVLVDVGRVDTATTVLGIPVSMPVLLAPTAYHRLADPEGETATVRGAGASGTLMTASTLSTRTLEEIAAAASGPLWFQLYVYRDRNITERLTERAGRAGYRALVLTVDTPRLGRRERDLRSGFRLPSGVTIANLAGEGDRRLRWDAQGSMAAYASEQLDPSLTWEAVEWLKGVTSLPIVLKGVMRPDDAARAVEAGVSGIWVSNHGGRQLDAEEATILALPGVVESVRGRAEVFIDGGFRRGTDVLKALALGARAALIGRPYLWGLAAAGEAGVRRVLDLLRDELALSMALAGAPDIPSIDRSLVVHA